MRARDGGGLTQDKKIVLDSLRLLRQGLGILHICAGDAAAGTQPRPPALSFSLLRPEKSEASLMKRKEIPEALLPQTVKDVEAGETSYEILAARCGMCRDTFVRRIREMGVAPRNVDSLGRRLTPRKPKPAPSPTAHMMVSAALNTTRGDREPDETPALALRLRREIDHQLGAIERMRQDEIDDAAYQRLLVISRMLTGLTRTLQAAMRAEQTTAPEPRQDYDFARDYAGIRCALSERLAAFAARAKGGV